MKIISTRVMQVEGIRNQNTIFAISVFLVFLVVAISIATPTYAGQDNKMVTKGVLEVKLWPSTPPFAVEDTTSERTLPDRDDNIIRVTNVREPTITIYPAEQSDTNVPAVLICPGGGYRILAMNLEGTEIASWFNSVGITAALLKYRVPQNRKGAFADVQRAVRLLRTRADEWNIDSGNIGVMGFSAGGHLSARVSTHYEEQAYQPVDMIDSLSARPDFSMLIYPGYLVNEGSSVNPDVEVDEKTPPTFLVQTQDDGVGMENSLYFYADLTRKNISAEMHIFNSGGHGYGMRAPESQPVSHWPELLENWLKAMSIIK